MPNIANRAKSVGADSKGRVMIRYSQEGSIRSAQQLVLVRQLQTRVEIILIKEVHGRLGYVAIKIENLSIMIFMVAAPDQTRGPIPTIEWFVVGNRRCGASHIARLQGFRIAQQPMTHLHRPIAIGSE